jgi:hypothetical protein
MRRSMMLAGLTALGLLASGCGLGCKDVDRVYAATRPGFTVSDATSSDSTPVALYASLDYTQTSGVDDFSGVFRVLAKDAGDSRNLLMTLHGYGTPPADRLDLALSVPTKARTGDEYPIVAAFPPPPYRTAEWGFRAPLPQGQVEIGFTRSHAAIPNSPYDYVPHYTATAASGTVRIVRRDRGVLLVAIDAVVSDGAGRSLRVKGTVSVEASTHGQACISLD